MVGMLLAYPFLPGDLSQIVSKATLERHVVLAVEAGFPDVAEEYRAELARREINEMEKAAA